MNTIGLLICIGLLVSTYSFAQEKGEGDSSRVVDKASSGSTLLETQSALALPMDERLQRLRAQGIPGYHNLQQLMFDPMVHMEARWRAATALAHIGGDRAEIDIEKALASKEWYMRSVGLTAMQVVNRSKAKDWAHRLLEDKALIVRSAAVEAIRDLKDQTAAELLWSKLNSKENFKGHQSLWIRKQMVEALSDFSKTGQENKFIALLDDEDQALHAPAIRALETLTQKKLGGEQEPVKFKRTYWQQWWKQQTPQ